MSTAHGAGAHCNVPAAGAVTKTNWLPDCHSAGRAVMPSLSQVRAK
jgi:hypothetical protein